MSLQSIGNRVSKCFMSSALSIIQEIIFCTYRRTVQKDGPNKGRLFYSCQKPMTESCKFFQWADENLQNHNKTFRKDNNNTSRGREHKKYGNTQKKPRATGGKRKCGICGVEGL